MVKSPTGETPRAQKRYAGLKAERQEYLDRARMAAKVTVPYLMPPEGHTGSQKLPEPFNRLGARGVKHLASKLLLTMFPTTAPFFKYQVDELLVEELTQQPELRGEIDSALAVRERAIHNEIAATMFRPTSFEAIRQLLVSGNYLMYIPRKGGIKGFRLDQYVVVRDHEGNVLEIVIEEKFVKDTLPDHAKVLIEEAPPGDDKSTNGQKDINLYTHIYRDGKKFKVYQEVDGKIVPKSEGSYPLELNEFIPLRLTSIPGEDYGHSYVEEFVGDLANLEVLTQAYVEGTAIAARTIFGVEPGSSVNVNKVKDVANGGFFYAEQGSIWALNVDKRVDFQNVQSMIGDIRENLAFAFLLNSAIQRNGERVTAEEIRFMASEIEDGLGGMYSLLAEEFQRPVVKLFEKRMETIRKVPGLPKGAASPKVVTGLDALGRGHDSQALDVLGGSINQMFGPQVLQAYMKPGEFIKRKAAAIGVDTNGLIKTDEEIEAEQQQAQQQALLQQLGPNAINQLGSLAQNGVAGTNSEQDIPEEIPQDDN